MVEDPEALALLQELERREAPSLDRQVGAIRALHDGGFRSDARRLARDLPESPEREAFLRPPGR